MALRPVWQWQLDKDGNPKLDKDGKRIPHKYAGHPKKISEYSAEEKRDFDYAIRSEKLRRLIPAQGKLADIEKARQTVDELGDAT